MRDETHLNEIGPGCVKLSAKRYRRSYVSPWPSPSAVKPWGHGFKSGLYFRWMKDRGNDQQRGVCPCPSNSPIQLPRYHWLEDQASMFFACAHRGSGNWHGGSG